MCSHVKDLCALIAAAARPDGCGQAFNIGGGPGNTMSLLELLAYLRMNCASTSPALGRLAPRRPARLRLQPRCARERLGWQPQIGVREGVKDPPSGSARTKLCLPGFSSR